MVCMDLSGQTILVTGGTGSFGYAFVERLLPTTTTSPSGSTPATS